MNSIGALVVLQFDMFLCVTSEATDSLRKRRDRRKLVQKGKLGLLKQNKVLPQDSEVVRSMH